MTSYSRPSERFTAVNSQKRCIDYSNIKALSEFECEYRATKREELTKLFAENGCKSVSWLEPYETGFYQPVVIARKK